MPTEVEIKLALAGPEEYQRLLDRLGEAREVIRQHNVFFDGPDGELGRARITLRLREEKVYRADVDAPHEVRTALTLKGEGSVEGDVHARAEYEALLVDEFAELRADPSRLLALDVAPIRALNDRAGRVRQLIELGGFLNERRVYEVAVSGDAVGGGATLRWEVDRTTFADGRVDYEIEVELADRQAAPGTAKAMREMLDALGIRHRTQPRTKFARCRAYEQNPPL